jgi:hypothetical protein
MCCTGGTLWHLQKFLQCIMVEFPLHHSPLSPLPHSWNSFNRSHFSIFIHGCIIFHHIYPLLLPLPLLPTPIPRQELFYLPLLHFWKKDILFKIAMQGISLWHFHVCMYYNPIGSSPPFFSFYLSRRSLLMVISTGLKILYSFLCRKCISHSHHKFLAMVAFITFLLYQ